MAQQATVEPITPPFACNFNQEEDLEQWQVADLDNDGETWRQANNQDWPDLEGNMANFFVAAPTIAEEGKSSNDWLIMAKPITLQAGPAYVALLYASGHRSEQFPEHLAVYYGKEDKAVNMERNGIKVPNGDWEFYGREWKFKVLEFTVETAGDYYFAFRHMSENKGKESSFTIIDDVEIGQGKYPGAPNLVLDYLYLPLSSCGLTNAETVGVDVTNKGKTPITKVKLSCRVNDGEPVEEEMDVNIAPMATAKVFYTHRFDFSEPDRMYNVEVEGQVVASANGTAEQVVDAKNKIKDSVKHYTVAALPFETNMNLDEERAQWSFASGSWIYDKTKVLAISAQDTLPLVSRCVELTAGRNYRFSFGYVAGHGFIGTPSDFDVLCGTPNTPVSTWKTLKSYVGQATEDAVVEDEFVFEAEASGAYAFAIVLHTQFGLLHITKINISEIKEHDIVMKDWVTRLGRLTPARHAVKPSFEVLAINRGMNDESGVKVVVKQGETRIGETDAVDIKKDDSYVFRPVDGQMAQPAVGSEVTLALSLEMPNEDGNPLDNKAEFTFTATDTAYVFDEVTEDPERSYGVAKNYTIGNIFTLAEQDTLTSVTIAWMDLKSSVNADFEVAVEVYPVDILKRTVGNLMLHHTTMRGLAPGYRTITLPARILPAGNYLIGLTQLGEDNMSVGVDDADGYFFVAANNAYVIQGGEGFLGIRANFGQASSVVEKDIAVTDIPLPKAEGGFTANQLVTADYVNNGSLSVEVEFKCTVNGDQVKTVKRTVPAYASGSVNFEMDLSKIGQHTIVVEAILEGDEDLDNNAAKRTVTCVQLDPRVMTFEYCDDFIVSGFEPAWKSVDVDGIKPGSADPMVKLPNIPNVNAPFGFMVYNSLEAGEVDETTGRPLNMAHSGERCGMSLVTSPASNDWLISPMFQLAEDADSLGVEFWVRSADPDFLESYNVLISTSDDKPASFEPLMHGRASADWVKWYMDLKDYAGKNIYIAFQCVTADGWMFLIDDIVVKTGMASNEKAVDLSRYVKAYPNPVTDVWTVTAYGLEIRQVEICNMAGNVVFRSADNLATEVYRVSTDRFTPGLYMARIYTNAGLQVQKVMVR